MNWWDRAFDVFWQLFLVGTLTVCMWVVFRLTGVCR
jgi:hypothetical protein